MTTTPYARLGVRVNAGAPQYGGITVAHGDMVQFVAESTAYWGTPAAVWQIFDYPEGWTGPGAPWVSLTVPQANGLPDAVVFQYTGNTAPPAFAMPALPYWGKFLPSLFVNGGTIQGKAAPQLYDESTAVQILSPSALVEPAFRETSQFGSWRGFAGVLKALVRLIDGLFASVPSLSNATPQAVGTAAAGVGTEASRHDHVHAHGNQASNGSMHAAAIASGAAGFMTGTDKALVDTATASATANALTKRGASGEAAFAYLYPSGSVPTTGFLRGQSGFVAIATLTGAGSFDNVGFSDDSADGWKVGNDTRAAAVRLAVKTGGSATVEVNNVVEVTIDAGGINLAAGNTYQVNGVAHATAATNSSLAFRGSSAELSVGYLYSAGTVSTIGFIRLARNFTAIGCKTSGGTDHPILAEDNADGFVMGSSTLTAGWTWHAQTGGAHTMKVSDVAKFSVTGTVNSAVATLGSASTLTEDNSGPGFVITSGFNTTLSSDAGVVVQSGAGEDFILKNGSFTGVYIDNTTVYVAGLAHSFTATGIGFYGAPAAAKPTVTGSRGGNAALASLLTALANLGLITDGSS